MEFFGESVLPNQVYVCATVAQCLSVVNACKSLGLDTVLCRGHRLNSAVMWAMGINGSVNTVENPEMKALVTKCAALVGIYSHSAVNNDALLEIQKTMPQDKVKELEELCLQADIMEMDAAEHPELALLDTTFTPLNTTRRNDTRCAFVAMLSHTP